MTGPCGGKTTPDGFTVRRWPEGDRDGEFGYVAFDADFYQKFMVAADLAADSAVSVKDILADKFRRATAFSRAEEQRRRILCGTSEQAWPTPE